MSPGLEREKTTDKMAPLIHVYHLLFISLTNAKSSQKFPSLFCLSIAAITFFSSCPPIKCHWPHSRLGRPHLNWQCVQMTSFSSVRLRFIKLRLVEILIGYLMLLKLQLQMCCHWVWPSLVSPYFLRFFIKLNNVWLQYGTHKTEIMCVHPGVLSAAPYKLGSSHFCEQTY